MRIVDAKEEISTELAKNFSRVVRRPRKRTGHIYLTLCKPSGEIKEEIITKGHGDAYYTSARKTKWGDGFIAPEEEIVHVQTGTVIPDSVSSSSTSPSSNESSSSSSSSSDSE